MAMFTNPRELPDDLLPYSGKLSDRLCGAAREVIWAGGVALGGYVCCRRPQWAK